MRTHLLLAFLGAIMMAGLAWYAREDLAKVDLNTVLSGYSSSGQSAR